MRHGSSRRLEVSFSSREAPCGAVGIHYQRMHAKGHHDRALLQVGRARLHLFVCCGFLIKSLIVDAVLVTGCVAACA